MRELSHTASRFGGPRRTTLGGEVRRVEERGGKRAMTVVAQPRTDIWVCSTAAGVSAAWPRATRMDGFPVELGAGDRPLAPLATDTEADLNAFAADGTVYRVRAAELPVSARQSKGVRAVGVGRGGQVAALAPLEPEGGFLLLVTARGEVKRVEASVYASSHASGSPAYDVPDGDRLVAVLPHGEGAHALLHSARGQSLRIDLDRLRPVKSPGAGGVAGMRLDGGDEIVAVTPARDGDLLLVAHAGGHAKVVPVELFPVKGRGTGGVQSAARRHPAARAGRARGRGLHAGAGGRRAGALAVGRSPRSRRLARARGPRRGLPAAGAARGRRRGGRRGGRAPAACRGLTPCRRREPR